MKILPKDISFLANDLINRLNNELSNQLKIIGDILVDDVRGHIDSDVYAKYTPIDPMYERTENLKRAVKKSPVTKTIDGISIDVYVDDNIAKSHHMNDSNNSLESYAEIVETGEGYDFNYPYGYNRPRPFMKNTIENNSDSIANLISNAVGDAIKKL